MADGVDAEDEIEGRGGEGQVLQVGLGEPEGQGTGVKEGPQVPDDGPLPVQAQDLKPGPGQGHQVAPGAAARFQDAAEAAGGQLRHQGHDLRVGRQALHQGIGKNFSPVGHGLGAIF